MRFAHISDLHFTTTPARFPIVRSDVSKAVDMLVSDLKTIEGFLDFIAISGDIAEAGDIDSYRKISTTLEVLDVPVLMVPGNHDMREPFRDVFAPRCGTRKIGRLDFSMNIAGARIIGLDTLVDGKTTGRLTGDQLAWLGQELSASRGAHTVVIMHHPPFLTGLREFDDISKLDGHEAFADLIENTRSEVTVLSGHIHRPYQAVWKGANCYVAGSLANQFGGDDPFGDSVLRPVKEPYAYFVHTLGGPGDHVVSTRYVDLGEAPDPDASQRNMSS